MATKKTKHAFKASVSALALALASALASAASAQSAKAPTPASYGKTIVNGRTVPCMYVGLVCQPVALDGSQVGGTLPPGDLPAPTATTPGGVLSGVAPAHQFGTGIDGTGAPTYAQPAAGDVSGLAASATTDTTNAGNIGSGTLSPARIPAPTATTPGGVLSGAAPAHQFGTGIDGTGAPTYAQPAAGDVSGLAASATTDTTNASNLSSGTVAAPRLPNTIGDFTTGAGTNGFVPRLVGKVFAAKYLSDITCTTDQTSNLNAASNAAGVGGIIELPHGCINSGPVTTLDGQHWNGAGPSFKDGSQYDKGTVGTSGGTTIAFGQASGNLFPLVGSGASLRNVALVDTYSGSTPKTSTAVQFGNSNGPSDSANGNPESQGVENVRVYGFSTQLDVQSGEFWRIHDFDLHNAGTYALRVRNAFNSDSGDGRLVGGTIYGAGTDAIRFESGGGFKMGFTKILGGVHAIEIAMADDSFTSDFEVDSTNSIENQTGAAILIGCGGSAKTGQINGIHFDPQIAGLGTASAGAGIDAEGCVQGIDIAGYYGGLGSPLVLNGGSNFTIHPRGINAVTSVGLTIGAAVTGVQVPTFPKVTFNKSIGSGYYNIIDNRTTDDGVVDRTDARYLTLPVSSSYTTLYGIGVPSYRGARATVEIEGIVQNVGAVHVFQDVLLTPQGSTSTSTISSVGASSSLDLQFVLSGQTYSVNLRANGSQNANASFAGSLSIKVQGKTNSWQID